MSTTLTELFAPIVESKPTRKPRRTAQPVTIVTPEGDRKPARPTKAQHLAEQFTAWAQATTNLDQATLRLIAVLVNDSVSARRASEIATEALGTSRGWSKDKITAIRWTAPLWACLGADLADRPVDDEGDIIAVADLLAEVRTITSVLGSARTATAVASVDEPSAVAYLVALRDALTGDNAPVAVADDEQADEAEAEAEVEPTATTDADRIQAVLNTLSGIEFDETLVDALPTLVDRLAEIVAKATAPATV